MQDTRECRICRYADVPMCFGSSWIREAVWGENFLPLLCVRERFFLFYSVNGIFSIVIFIVHKSATWLISGMLVVPETKKYICNLVIGK